MPPPRSSTKPAKPPARPARDRDVYDAISENTGALRAEVIEVFDERAAIREYLGGVNRVTAERFAAVDTERSLRKI